MVALLGKTISLARVLAGQPLRLSTVSAMTQCVIVRIAKADITRVIDDEPAFAELSSRTSGANSRVEEDLVDLLFNSSEKRLARNYSENQPRDTGGDDRHDAISCEPFHEQIWELGLIDHNGHIEVTVRC